MKIHPAIALVQMWVLLRCVTYAFIYAFPGTVTYHARPFLKLPLVYYMDLCSLHGGIE